jgi:upstream activation factor subunit UAF30
MARFDLFAERKGIGASSPTNGDEQRPDSATPVEPSSPSQSSTAHKRQADSVEQSDGRSSKTPPPSKKQKSNHDIDADALFAAKLQAEENMRARTTRGAGSRKAAPAKKKKITTAKTAKRVKAEDDSDIGSGSDSGKKVNRSGGFHVCGH